MQMESGAGVMGKLEAEKAQLRDAMGDLKAKIAALEAQVSWSQLEMFYVTGHMTGIESTFPSNLCMLM